MNLIHSLTGTQAERLVKQVYFCIGKDSDSFNMSTYLYLGGYLHINQMKNWHDADPYLQIMTRWLQASDNDLSQL